MEQDLEQVVRLLVQNRWPFRLHATYDETIGRALDVYERINRELPFEGLHWFFDHAETVSDRNLERIKALGGGIAVQDRMAFQGEYFVDRYGAEAAQRTPPIKRMLEMGIPVGAGTDATRVSSHNPYVALHWLVTGKTVGGLELYPAKNLLDRTAALRLYTQGSAWFSNEQDLKGTLKPGQFADLAVLSAPYFDIPADEIPNLSSVLTLLNGHVVYAAEEFSPLGPAALPVSPDWSPAGVYGVYQRTAAGALQRQARNCSHGAKSRPPGWVSAFGCDCFAF